MQLKNHGSDSLSSDPYFVMFERQHIIPPEGKDQHAWLWI